MKKNLLSKNIHQWLLLLVCFVGTLSSWAEEYKRDGIIYDLNRSAKTATVKGFVTGITSAEVKNYAAGCKVTSIGWSAFSGCSSLTSINIPNSVTSIGWSAFSGCSSLTSINIPNSVTSIGEKAFSDCSSLTSINIPSSVTSIVSHAFYHCSSLTSVNIPSSVTSIEYRAFLGCSSLTSINIPNSVTSIGECAFYGCSSLTSINIPSSVTSIGSTTFSGCSVLTAFTVDANNPNYCADGCMLFNKEKTELVFAVGNQKTYNIPSSVTSIGESAFSYCSSLTSINIPNSVTSIGVGAFYNCIYNHRTTKTNQKYPSVNL